VGRGKMGGRGKGSGFFERGGGASFGFRLGFGAT
jgi:hypothetical protein